MLLESPKEAFVLQKALDAVTPDGDVLKPVEEVIPKLVSSCSKKLPSKKLLRISDDLTAMRSF